MKTLGQIAYETGAHPAQQAWDYLPAHLRLVWNEVARIIRKQVIEECAKVADAHNTGDNTREDEEAFRIASAIRALK